MLLFELNIVHECMKKPQSKLGYVESNDAIIAAMQFLSCSYDGKVDRLAIPEQEYMKFRMRQYWIRSFLVIEVVKLIDIQLHNCCCHLFRENAHSQSINKFVTNFGTYMNWIRLLNIHHVWELFRKTFFTFCIFLFRDKSLDLWKKWACKWS